MPLPFRGAAVFNVSTLRSKRSYVPFTRVLLTMPHPLHGLSSSTDNRPVSAPIPIPARHRNASSRASSAERPSSLFSGSLTRSQLSHELVHGTPNSSKESLVHQPSDITGFLQRSEPLVVKSRTGSVLSRGFILKTDHYPSGRALDLDLNVHGAPNFRAPRIGDFNVFGAAQPRTQGLRAILSILRCQPGIVNQSHVVWFSTREEPIVYISGRPFVLRDASEPRRTLALSDRAENLEAIETRLRNDILQEAARYGGVLLTHNEIATAKSGEGAILPTWTAVDHNNVKTSKELWEYMKAQGWNVDDNYLDAYLRVIRETDPLKTSLVFSCGMGAVRTTFAMVAASLVRRKQLIALGMHDPYAGQLPQIGSPSSSSGVNTTTYVLNRLKRALERVDAGPGGKNTVFWTSLREEPVVYVGGRPHVLRLVDRPLENLEATGVTTHVVEGMEQSFKKDVLRELRAGNGRVLLHDELEDRPGTFSVVPVWENVTEDEILTPKDVINSIRKEGYKIDYARIAITDEQAPLPDALWQMYERIRSGLSQAGDFVFNCQMGRGRTTTGMVAACLISTTMHWDGEESTAIQQESETEFYDSIDGLSEEKVYLRGEYKTILQLVGVLSHGKAAKRLADGAVDLMQDVQNLRNAIYDYKLKMEACEKGSIKERKLRSITVNYLYRYGTLIVFANYLIEMKVLKSFLSRKDTLLEVEKKWLKEIGAHVVLSDAAFLGCLAANVSGIPSILITNFTFDSVYSYLSTPLLQVDLEASSHSDHLTPTSPKDNFTTLVPDIPVPSEETIPLVAQIFEGYRCADLLVRLPGHIPIPSFAIHPSLPAPNWVDASSNSFHMEIIESLSLPVTSCSLHASIPLTLSSRPNPPRSIIQAPLLVRSPSTSPSPYSNEGRCRLLSSIGVPQELHDPMRTKILIVSFGGQVFRAPSRSSSRSQSRSGSPSSSPYISSPPALKKQHSGSALYLNGSATTSSFANSGSGTPPSPSVPPRLATPSHLWIPGAPPASKPHASLPSASSVALGFNVPELATIPPTPSALQTAFDAQPPASQLASNLHAADDVFEDCSFDARLLPDESWIAIVCGASKENFNEDDAGLPDGFYVAPRDVYMPDLTAVGDVLLGKLGYGTVSECVDAHTPFVYVSRPLFIEEHGLRLLLDKEGVGVELSRQSYEAGDWTFAVEEAWARGQAAKERKRADALVKLGLDDRREEGIDLARKVVGWTADFWIGYSDRN
ncbi:hypothetical protein H0H93_010544 [Arthromyces matolae]|nr:hypothetical protein H0H93_010544 [Arthromyces matolae]